MQLIDTTIEADGDRKLINRKISLIKFRSLNLLLKCLYQLHKLNAYLHQGYLRNLDGDFFCNWTGGKTRNIEDDLAQEVYNNISKNAVKHLGRNKSIETIDRKYRDTSGIKEIRDNFDGTTKIHKSSTRHRKIIS